MSGPVLVRPAAGATLVADGKTLSTAPHRLGRLTPTAGDADLATIRSRYDEHGYVWLKGFLERQAVTDFRGWVFGHFADAGLVRPGSDPALGLAATEAFDRSGADRRLMALVRSAAYEGFCAQPRLVRLMDRFLGGELPAQAKDHALHPARDGHEHTGPLRPRLPAGRHQPHRHGMDPDRRHAGGHGRSDLPRRVPCPGHEHGSRVRPARRRSGTGGAHQRLQPHHDRRRMDLEGSARHGRVDDEIDARWANHWSLDDML